MQRGRDSAKRRAQTFFRRATQSLQAGTAVARKLPAVVAERSRESGVVKARHHVLGDGKGPLSWAEPNLRIERPRQDKRVHPFELEGIKHGFNSPNLRVFGETAEQPPLCLAFGRFESRQNKNEDQPAISLAALTPIWHKCHDLGAWGTRQRAGKVPWRPLLDHQHRAFRAEIARGPVQQVGKPNENFFLWYAMRAAVRSSGERLLNRPPGLLHRLTWTVARLSAISLSAASSVLEISKMTSLTSLTALRNTAWCCKRRFVR